MPWCSWPSVSTIRRASDQWKSTSKPSTVPFTTGSVGQIATRHDGVDKVYAMQAGREIRVMVRPGALDDDGAVLLSHEIAREIEQELEYPGQIKVTVIRESRATDYAR